MYWGAVLCSVVKEPEAASIPPVRPLSALIGLVRVEGKLQSRTAGKEEGARREEGRERGEDPSVASPCWRSGYKGSLVKGRQTKLEAVLLYGHACESVGKLQHETREKEPNILFKPAGAATLHVLARLAGSNVPNIPSQLQPDHKQLEPRFEASPSGSPQKQQKKKVTFLKQIGDQSTVFATIQNQTYSAIWPN
ncbi:hypothetical protein LY78DRAFT_86966 [Colletotrichum sublineola]|nr:hypothetical protein LY78DRAFT_86966 [Colletotrichum sublineola]